MKSVNPKRNIEQKENTIKDSVVTSPSVTIGIPVLNEEKHIDRVISKFLDTEYPNLIEILVADGGSSDRTREIVNELSNRDPRVRLIDNPEKFQSFGLNNMIDVAKGEIFLRADGHCFYNSDYVEKCVKVISRTGAKNVGGAQRYKATNYVQVGIALAVKSFLGNGGAKYMNENYEGYGDTVFLGCFWTADLKELGGFNTENITNQDSELNLRLIERFGKSVYISPEIKSWYFPRSSFRKLFKQYVRYGRGRFLTRILHPQQSPIRALIPFISIFSLISFVCIDFFTIQKLYSLEFVLIIAGITILESIRVTFVNRGRFEEEIWQGEKNSPDMFIRLISCIISLVIMQLGHFSGFLYQLGKGLFKGIKEW